MDQATAHNMMIWMSKMRREGYIDAVIHDMIVEVLRAIEGGYGTKNLTDQEVELYSVLDF
jgi:hypothetical protein